MKILRRIYYPDEVASNMYNFGVKPFWIHDDVEEDELVRVLNEAGNRVDIAKRFGVRDGHTQYIGYDGMTIYVEQEAAHG